MRFTKSWQAVYLLLCVLLAAVFSILNLTAKSLWLDEASSISFASKRLPDMFAFFWNHEANAWLYYLLLHFWSELGKSEFAYRSMSVLFAILTVPATYLLGKKVFNPGTANLAILLLPFNAFFIAYAQETRAYSLEVLLTTLATYFFVRCIDSPQKRAWLFYLIFTVSAIYVHFFALLVLFSQIIVLFIYHRPRLFSKIPILCFIIIFVLVCPIFLAPSFRGGQLNAAVSLRLKDIGGIFLALAGGLPALFIIYNAIFLFGSRLLHLQTWKYKLVLSLYLFPIFFTFLFSVLIKPIYGANYLIICLVPFLLLISYGLNEIKKSSPKLFLFLLTVIILLSALSLSVFYTQNKKMVFFWSISKGVEDWRGASEYVVANAKEGDGVTFYIYYVRLPFEYYSKSRVKLFDLSDGDYSINPDVPVNNSKLLELPAHYSRVWLVLSHHHNTKLGREEKAAFIQKYLAKNYLLKSQKSFTGDITVFLFIAKTKNG